MNYKLVGFQHQKGKFVDRETGAVIDYDNIVFYTIHDPILDNFYGQQCSQFKIAARFLTEDIEKDYAGLKRLLGKYVTFESVPAGKVVRYVDILEVMQ